MVLLLQTGRAHDARPRPSAGEGSVWFDSKGLSGAAFAPVQVRAGSAAGQHRRTWIRPSLVDAECHVMVKPYFFLAWAQPAFCVARCGPRTDSLSLSPPFQITNSRKAESLDIEHTLVKGINPKGVGKHNLQSSQAAGQL